MLARMAAQSGGGRMNERHLMDTTDLAVIKYGYQHGASVDEIAAIIGCSPSSVYVHARNMYQLGELPEFRDRMMGKGNKRDEDKVNEAKRLLLSGVSVRAVAEHLGVSPSAVYLWRKELPIVD